MILAHAKPGEKYDTRASTYNAFVDAANAERVRVSNPSAVSPSIVFESQRILVANDSGSDCDAFNILALDLDGSKIAPGDLNKFQKDPTVVSGVTPSSDPTQPIAILTKPCKTNRVVPGIISGVTVAKVDILESTDRYVCTQSVRNKLRSAQFGQGRILHRERGGAAPPTEDWCKIQLGITSPLRVKAKIDNGGPIAANGSGLVQIYTSGVGPAENTPPLTVRYDWMIRGADLLPDETEVIVEFFPAQAQWVIVAADCPEVEP